MEKVRIPGTGLEASRIGIGTWAIGGWMWGGSDEKQCIAAIHRAVEKGINLIDTAPVYGFGKSEEIVGRALRELDRDSLVLATKAGIEWSDDESVARNATPERLRRELEDSLRRLGVDHIDIYQVHWPDPLVPIEETARQMQDFIEEGKIIAAGVSNYSPAQMDAFRSVASLSTDQPPYNLFERGIEDDILPYCRENGVALLAYGSLCRGLLSGKMKRDTDFEGDDLRQIDPKFRQPRYDQYLEAVGRLGSFARENYGRELIHLAVRWILDMGVEMALWGARRPDQVETVDRVMGWSLDESALAEIDRILEETVKDPVGPEFMAPPDRKQD